MPKLGLQLSVANVTALSEGVGGVRERQRKFHTQASFYTEQSIAFRVLNNFFFTNLPTSTARMASASVHDSDGCLTPYAAVTYGNLLRIRPAPYSPKSCNYTSNGKPAYSYAHFLPLCRADCSTKATITKNN